MVLTKEENEFLTRVAPGTPCGELMRRYWHPVAFTEHLTEENSTLHVRLLGEDLVLFRDKAGRPGLLADHCSHRGASLLYGRVEERGIACAYHGWLYDTQGNCLETPAEPAGSLFHLTVKHRAYPVQKFIGMYWAYLGPEPTPVIPRYDIWVRKDGRRRIYLRGRVACNWLQCMENSVDTAHSLILHQITLNRGVPPPNTTRGLVDSLRGNSYRRVPFGIMKSEDRGERTDPDHPVIFPNILRQANGTEIRVPIDDIHTWVFQVRFDPTDDGSVVDEAEPTLEYIEPHKEPMDARHPFARHRMDEITYQDYMAWETQGPVADRTVERLATSDKGVVLYREVLRENIEKVLRGEEPIGVVRDPDHAMIDTNLSATLDNLRRSQRLGTRGD